MGVKTAPESEDPYGEPFKFDPNFKGPIRKRSCTDVLCLILFILFLALWSFVGLVAFVKGDVKKVNKTALFTICPISRGFFFTIGSVSDRFLGAAMRPGSDGEQDVPDVFRLDSMPEPGHPHLGLPDPTGLRPEVSRGGLERVRPSIPRARNR